MQHRPLQAPKHYLDRFERIEDPKRRVFAAMLSAMDDAIGRVMLKIRDLGAEQRTLVFFIADNGGPTQGTTSRNGGLRGYKMMTYEGGPRVPFIVQWKGTLPSGTVYELPVLNLDVLPTAVTAAGGTVEPAWQLDGVDLVPHLTGRCSDRPHQTIFWRFGRQWAVRSGDWKLVVSHGGGGQPELYDLADDPGESRDLAAARPQQVAELQAAWKTWSDAQAAPSAPESPRGKNAGRNGAKRRKG